MLASATAMRPPDNIETPTMRPNASWGDWPPPSRMLGLGSIDHLGAPGLVAAPESAAGDGASAQDVKRHAASNNFAT